MLRHLIIKNVALIEHLEVPFGPGLNVLTGETGAGKSILLDSFALILGERADTHLIREGQETARVEGLFDVGGDRQVVRYLEGCGVPIGDELVVVRELHRDARNRCFVNGSLTTRKVLQGLGHMLVDLHGQHDHQLLLRPAGHLRLVDDFGDAGHREAVGEVRARAGEFRQVRRELDEAIARLRHRDLERELLDAQIGELDEAEPVEGEDAQLQEELKLLSGAEGLQVALGSAMACLDGDDEVPGALGGLERAAEEVRRATAKSGALADLVERLDEQAALLADLRDDLGRAAERVELDPERQREVEDRLAVLHRLARKHGVGADELEAVLQSLLDRRRDLEAGETRRDGLEARLAELEDELGPRVEDLSARRRVLAASMAEAVEGHLQDLAMAGARVEVRLERDEDPEGLPVAGARYRLREDGLDRAEILVATNPGGRPGGLKAIASGGEISRVMLGIKASLARLDMVPIMVFDEIDSGVGGETGHRIGEKLAAVSDRCQCLVVTHLPSVAARAGTHFRVVKALTGGRAEVRVEVVAGEDRVAEVARMLGAGEREGGKDLARALLAGEGGPAEAPVARAPAKARGKKAPAKAKAPAAKATRSKASRGKATKAKATSSRASKEKAARAKAAPEAGAGGEAAPPTPKKKARARARA